MFRGRACYKLDMVTFETWKGALTFFMYASLVASLVASGSRHTGQNLSNGQDEEDNSHQTGDMNEAQFVFPEECDHRLKGTFFDLNFG